MGRQRAKAWGFTLIELMGVIDIMGVITILIMPQVRGYTIRAKVTEGMQMISQCRNQVYEVYASGSDLPGANNYGCEVTRPSKYVQEITTTDDGVIVLQLGNEIADLRLSLFRITLAPLNGLGQRMSDADLGTIPRRWRCGSTLDGTDVELAAYLPSTCRG